MSDSPVRLVPETPLPTPEVPHLRRDPHSLQRSFLAHVQYTRGQGPDRATPWDRFQAVAMALCVATGLPFCGRRTKRSKVLYIAADDPDGPRMRAQAWVKHHAAELKELGISPESINLNAVMFDQAVNLHVEDQVVTAADDIKRQNLEPDLIIWDTLFHTTLCADLTLPKDVLPIFRRARGLMAEIEAHSSLMVHHTPKDG